ncbi:hypothetical protein TVAG_035240 [Trichomonas vaginalis G3]|uniref:Uncharacterized protein n=1 Tax=Trichomonas vaginalis (strain ATCC PRA-98 / G3) TaxID=412133 RepID=A2DAJ8_TRIV3|nr:hypothetical protein TVAGG3_0811280 [Trichomonas vaginalis G3]EAY22501.1 hypothetical protein TVAG_035240 [Trichomonas vaginalis G3]KAI5497227.1 hypothetical protein TVAGG3_0811280 [Trichomonas vaginalis G3]|eukprot:XP_001583487.1 hypothetical protein [Trichomonas vaginalis G3]
MNIPKDPKTQPKILSPKEQTIKRLKDTLQNIQKEMEDPLNSRGGANHKLINDIQELTNQRLESVDLWQQNELIAAQRDFDSQCRQIYNDEVYLNENANERMMHVLLLKHELLSKKLPNAAKYFNKMDCPFINEFVAEERKRNVSIDLDNPHKPVLSPQEAQEFLRDVPDRAYVKDQELHVGNTTFSIGTPCNVKLQNTFTFSGVISDIVSSTIFFTPKGGQKMALSVQSINTKVVEISK